MLGLQRRKDGKSWKYGLRSIYTVSVFARFDAMRQTQRFFDPFFDIHSSLIRQRVFFANARQNAPSILVRFRVEPSSTFATNYVRQLRNWMAGLAALYLSKLCWAVVSVFSSTQSPYNFV